MTLALVATATLCWAADEPTVQPILLWPEGAPLAQGTADKDKPRITVFLPKRQTTRTAVVICPGGGYAHLATDHEGKQVAAWLNNLGVVGVMLEYRLGPKYHHPAELLDAQRAIRYVRSHATELNVAPDRIGILGFSAGGHLASTVATHFDAATPNAPDAVDRVSSRPDFAVLVYPVIRPSGPASDGSFKRLLGDTPDPRVLQSLSNDTMVTPQTPPTFLVHSDDDNHVLPENSVNFYLALRKAGVPAELHIYQFGGHGYGLAPLDPVLSSWSGRLADWMRGRGLLNP
jgi:acetyl esterase/lipase